MPAKVKHVWNCTKQNYFKIKFNVSIGFKVIY